MKEIKQSIEILEKVFENENQLLELKSQFYDFKNKFEMEFENLEYVKDKKLKMDISAQMGEVCDDFLDAMKRLI